MTWKNKSNFLQVSEETKIHYKLNFEPSNLDKDDIVLIFNYGLVCNFQHFDLQVDYFDKKNYKILIHDYRNHFQSLSSEGIESVTFENICNDLKKLMDHLNIKSSIQLGHSMGVNVTLEMALRYPENIKSMILISGTVFPPHDVMFDSNIIDLSEPIILKAKETIGDFYTYIWKNAHKNKLAQIGVWTGGFNIKKTDIKWVEEYMRKIGELDPDLFFHLLDQMRDHQIINSLENIHTESLIIGGDKDKIIPNYLQRVLKRFLKNSTLYIVKDGSHVPQVDFPEHINHRIEHFIKRSLEA